MKKICAICAIVAVFVLSLAGCDGDFGGSSQELFTIANNFSQPLTNVVCDGVSFKYYASPEQILGPGQDQTAFVNSGSHYIYFDGGRTADKVTVSSKNKRFTFTAATKVVADNSSRSSTLQELFDGTGGGTNLRIKNESTYEITNVKWSGTDFVSGSDSIKSGDTVNKSVTAGSGYIFFTRKSGSIAVRTQELVSIEQDKDAVFTFTDNTLVLQVSNPGNTSTLGALTQTQPAGLSTSWSGNWIKSSTNDNEYSSNRISAGNTTWQTFTITSTYGCSVRVLLTASCYNNYRGDNYGYASKLDGSKSISDYQLRVTGTDGINYTYAVPAGTHYLYFGYARNMVDSSGTENITVEVASID